MIAGSAPAGRATATLSGVDEATRVHDLETPGPSPVSGDCYGSREASQTQSAIAPTRTQTRSTSMKLSPILAVSFFQAVVGQPMAWTAPTQDVPADRTQTRSGSR